MRWPDRALRADVHLIKRVLAENIYRQDPQEGPRIDSLMSSKK